MKYTRDCMNKIGHQCSTPALPIVDKLILPTSELECMKGEKHQGQAKNKETSQEDNEIM